MLERSTHFFLLEMGDRTGKVSTLRLKAARTPADTEPAKPPRTCPRAAAETAGAAASGGLQPSSYNATNIHIFSFFSFRPPASHRPAAEPTQPLSLPLQSLGGDLWWRTICSYCVSRLDRHVTYYSSHMLYICRFVDTRLSLPSLKYTVVAWLLTCLHLSTPQYFSSSLSALSQSCTFP